MKVVSNSPGLVDFAIGLVNSVLNLPNWLVKVLGNSNYRRTVINSARKLISLSFCCHEQKAEQT